MDCQQAKPALLEYLMEESSQEVHGEIERHLLGCGPCSQELDGLKETMGLLVRGEVSEEIPRRIRVVAEPTGWWLAFWRNPARLAFAGAGFACLAIAFLSLSRASISYQNGNFQMAFSAPAAAAIGAALSSIPPAGILPASNTDRPLDRAEINKLIAEALAAGEADQQRKAELMAKNVAGQVEERYQRDLRDMAGNLYQFQAAQNTMWKEQVQNQQLVGTLMHQAGLTIPAQP